MTPKRMNLETHIPKLEKELADANAKIADYLDELEPLMPAVRDSEGCLIPSVWTRIWILHDKIDTIRHSVTEHKYDIQKWKQVANGNARRAYLNQKRFNSKAVWNPPYPEIRG